MPQYWDAQFETMPWREVEAYWRQELRRQIDYVRSANEFYRRRLKDGHPELSDIPFLTKEDLRSAQAGAAREHPLGEIQTVPTGEIVQVISSSGTSGRPVYYGLTRNDLACWREALARFFFTAGVRPEDIVVHTTAVPLFAGGDPYFEGMRHIGAMMVWTGGLSTARILETMKYLHCTVLQGTASFDVYLAEQCSRVLGIEPRELGISKVLGGGEPGLGEPAIRQKLKDLWGAATVREIMGLSDVLPGMWAECEEETGMHFCAQRDVAVELVDPASGEVLPWEAGVTGEPVYTTLRREATPVLRYRSRDLVRVEGVGCPCGRTSPKIRCIGRVDDMLIYKAMNVFPSAIRDVLLTYFGESLTGYLQIVKDYPEQVRFDTPIPVDVEVKSLELDLAGLKRNMEQRVRDSLNVRIEVNPVAPGSLERSEYKTRLVRVREGAQRK
ncbi:MAG: phenylacetate--CoA ligase family protein [Clostridia bacterium]|jgi:phenylacetate-CoA ligase/benzoylacetate-CoA ligase|nr:phenylacetate--CoA ligase family protein [Clostridia bacterium]MDH7572835.1 phenylacetate--CoA ligase family protein [Clostridia bacterium]